MSEIRKGYKQTKVGVIPKEWEVVKIGDVFDFIKTYSNSRSDLSNIGDIEYLHYGDIHTKYKYHLDFNKNILPKISLDKFKSNIEYIKNGDLLIADASEDYADIGKSVEVVNLNNRKVVSGLHTFLLRDKDGNFSNSYKGLILYNQYVSKTIKKIATGISVLGISKTNLGKLEIPLPPLKEQQKIADILTTWDNAISKQEELIKAKEELKKGLMQKLLSGEVRFYGFSDKWIFTKLGNLLDYEQPTKYLVANKDYDNSYNTPVLTAGKTFILGYTKEENGIFSNDLPVIIFDDFTTATKFVDFPFKAKSSAMKILKAKNKDVNIKLVFEMMQMLNYSADDHKRYWISEYQELEIKLPSFQEQQTIAQVLSTVDKEIELLKNKLESLKEQKRGLMQRLLNGEMRVKI